MYVCVQVFVVLLCTPTQGWWSHSMYVCMFERACTCIYIHVMYVWLIVQVCTRVLTVIISQLWHSVKCFQMSFASNKTPTQAELLYCNHGRHSRCWRFRTNHQRRYTMIPLCVVFTNTSTVFVSTLIWFRCFFIHTFFFFWTCFVFSKHNTTTFNLAITIQLSMKHCTQNRGRKKCNTKKKKQNNGPIQ